jgi:hypothetical protein
VSHFKFSLFFFIDNFSHIYIRTGTCTLGVYESDISYEGHMNRTQQAYNLLGQCVVCQYIYIYICIDFESLYEVKYKLEWTMEKEKKRDKSG